MSPKSEVFNVDCMVGMAQYPDKYFDLAVVDPPYGSSNIQGGYAGGKGGGIAGQRKYNKALWSQRPPDNAYFNELIRVSKNQIVWGANHFISQLPFDSPCWIVWDKDNGDVSFADCELAWTSFAVATRKFKHRWSGFLQENMKSKEIRIHPTQKPVALYEWIFKNYADQGMKVLDTHIGSRSSQIAAHNYGLDFIGFEIDKGYFDDGEKRYQNHIAQLRMF
jgi:site-specific DNA-methyltransferase (adenine-specific)